MPSPPPAVIADRDSGGLKQISQVNTRDRTRTAHCHWPATLVTAALARHLSLGQEAAAAMREENVHVTWRDFE